MMKSGCEIFVGAIESGGSNYSTPVIYICRIDHYFPIVSACTIPFKVPILRMIKIRRLPDTDNFVAACDGHLAVHNSASRQTWTLENVHGGDIVDFSIHKDSIISVGSAAGPLIMTKIDEDLKDVYTREANLITSRSASISNTSPESKGIKNQPSNPFIEKRPTIIESSTPISDFKVSNLVSSRSPTPEKPDMNVATSTLIYQTSPFDNVATYTYQLPKGVDVERVSANKKFTKIYSAGKKVHCLSDDSAPNQEITSSIFENRLVPKEVAGRFCLIKQHLCSV